MTYTIICARCGELNSVESLEPIHKCTRCGKKFMTQKNISVPDENKIYTSVKI